MSVSQDMFRAALLDPGRPAPDGLNDGAGHAADARFTVYRNNVTHSLIEALRVGFPILTRLLGQKNMDGLSRLFLRAHPPDSPLMMHYGQAMPDFLAKLPQVAHLGYLPDVARLELALRRSYHAADSTPLDPAELAALTPTALMATRVTLAPAVRVLCSDWPLYDIWRFNTREDAPKPAHERQDVLITRAAFDPAPHLLPPGGAAWIQSLQRGDPLETALANAQGRAPGFDPTATLTLLLTDNALTSLTQKA
ncbi:putative DNA-binding domain-containing protein [Rhodobacteraceae bacterium F11138]|nr:putative DNA-binding domain-containing protein [Rhodobacteraceae bacterium F11138]